MIFLLRLYAEIKRRIILLICDENLLISDKNLLICDENFTV